MAIDPKTGERIPDSSSQIDPETGERIATPKAPVVPPPAPKIPDGQHGMGTLKDTLGEVGSSLKGMGMGALGLLKGGPDQIPRNLAESIAKPSVEEWNTPSQPGVMIGSSGHPTLDKAMRSFPVLGPMTANADRINQTKGFGPAAANLITPVAAGELAGPVVGGLGKIGENVGLGLGNDALGSVGPKAFKYGQNAARGAYEENVLPAFTKGGAASKLDEVLPEAGKRISDKVLSSPNRVALKDIADSIESPLNEARGIIRGPGGGGRSTVPIDSLQDSMTEIAPGAQAPIYGPGAGTAFTADEAIQAIQASRRPLLQAPMEEVPLHEQPFTPGETSQPITLNNPTRRMPKQLPSRLETPMSSLSDVFPDQLPSGTVSIPRTIEGDTSGMAQHQSLGEIPGDYGGRQPLQGTMLRRPQFPTSSEPSGLTDLRHPEATAPDIWRTIQNVDKNTRFNRDPEIEGVNELRRSVRGGLRGNLEDAVPELKPLTQRYADLKQAEESLDRTGHQGLSMGHMLDAAKFPVQTTLGRGLYTGGKIAQGFSPSLRLAFPAIAAATQKEKR